MKRKKDDRPAVTIRLNREGIKEDIKIIAQNENTFANEIWNNAIEEYIKKHKKIENKKKEK